MSYLYTDALLRVEPMTIVATLPPGDAGRGAHLATVMGCSDCHRDDLRGGPLFNEPCVSRIVAPNLTRARTRDTDATLLRLFRTGAKADGDLALAMPLVELQSMTDQDAADVLAYLHGVPAVDAPDQGRSHLYPLARLGWATGKLPIKEFMGDPPESPQVLARRNASDPGEHLALIACCECHGRDFNGGQMAQTPPLVVAKGYTPEAFARLMKTGTTQAGTESTSGLMSTVARDRFSALSPDEVSALHAFLMSR